MTSASSDWALFNGSFEKEAPIQTVGASFSKLPSGKPKGFFSS